MGNVRTGIDDKDNLLLIFEDDTEEGSVIAMDLATAIEVLGLLFQLIEQAKGLAALKTAPTDGRGT